MMRGRKCYEPREKGEKEGEELWYLVKGEKKCCKRGE